MIKSLVLPAVLALVVGLAGSAGYAVMHARTEHAAQLATLDDIAKAYADSVAADSAHADSLHGDAAHADSLHADSLLDTPADSIRALLAAREADSHAPAGGDTHAASHSGGGASHDAPATTILGAGAKDEAHTTEAAKATADSAKPRDDFAAAANAATRAIAESANETIPEKRLAKIFSAMSPRDAAKVLEQMSDGDVRTILALMGDRQAAAVLAQLPASRAAVITIGRLPRPTTVPDSGSTTP
jgi:flagellar motility protein MotE (MotC chaperone)